MVRDWLLAIRIELNAESVNRDIKQKTLQIIAYMLGKIGPLFVLLVTLGNCMLGSAKEWVFEETGLSLQIPDDPAWQKMKSPKPEAKLILQRTDKIASIFLSVSEAPSGQKSMDEEYAERFEKQYYSHPGVVKRSGEFFNFHGKRAYKMTGEMSAKDATLKTVHILWIDGGKFFQISLMRRSSNPLDDATIKVFVDSAKFNRKA